MPERRPTVELGRLLALQQIFRFLRESRSRLGVVFFALLYLFGSLLGGGMLGLFRLQGGYTVEIVLGTGSGVGWWNYPGLLVIAPWGVLALPFLSTLVMLVVSAGVGLGMTVAVVLAYRLLRPQPGEIARSKAIGVGTGLTPAMIGLVTLGACCSTTTAATAGVGLVAAASGTTVAALLLNNWILGIFQLAVVWIALIAQELLLTIYGGWFRRTPSDLATPVPPPVTFRYLVGLTLRVGLITAGLLWTLAIFVQWPATPPDSAGPGVWFQWVAQHGVVGVFAVVVGLFPGVTASLLGRASTRVAPAILAALFVSGISLLVWLPPVLIRAGLDSLPAEILGSLGWGSAWGAIPGVAAVGIGTVARWVLEYGLLAGFAVGFALAPRRVSRLLLDTVSVQGWVNPDSSSRARPRAPEATDGAPGSARQPDVR